MRQTLSAFGLSIKYLFFRLMMCVLMCISMHVLPGCGELGPCWSDSAGWWAGGWKWSILEVRRCGGAEAAQTMVHQDDKLRQGMFIFGKQCLDGSGVGALWSLLITIMADKPVTAAAALILQSDPWKLLPLSRHLLTGRVVSSVGQASWLETSTFVLQGVMALSRPSSPQESWYTLNTEEKHFCCNRLWVLCLFAKI